MTSAELEEWREHPVTREILAGLRVCLDRERDALTRAYWDGVQNLEADRKAFFRRESLLLDLSEASADDFQSMMEPINAG